MSDMASPYKELAFVFNTDLSSASEIFDSKASFLKKNFIYLFIFGCIGSSLLRVGFL